MNPAVLAQEAWAGCPVGVEMSDLIHYRLDDCVDFISLDRDPLNTLDRSLCRALVDACERAAADPAVQAMVIHGHNGVFSAGNDAGAFSSDADSEGWGIPSTLSRLARIHKPMIAAIGGKALGTGLELALVCGYRLAEPEARLGLLDISVGLIPGGGGTQRLPRLIGVESALNLILSGEQVCAETARLLGIVDRLAPSAALLLEEARHYALELIACYAPARPAEAWPEPAEGLPDDFLARYRIAHEPRWRSRLAPRLVLSAMEAACLLPLEEGLARELALFKQAEASRQAKALRHVHLAEQEIVRDHVADSATARRLGKVAIVGAGTMGAEIARSFVNAGISVALLESNRRSLEKGLAQIKASYLALVDQDAMVRESIRQRMDLLFGTLDFNELFDADLVIETVGGTLESRRQLFLRLEEVCKPGAILATGTACHEVDSIAEALSRPEALVGLHYFRPADEMFLLEIVPGAATSSEAVAAIGQLARQVRKLPVACGAGFGSIGKRMFEAYTREASRLVLEGASPAQVDRALTALDLNMGIFSLLDLIGIDVSRMLQLDRSISHVRDASYCRLGEALYSMGRFGCKSGRGFYQYDGLQAQDDEEVNALAVRLADELRIERRSLDDEEIRERCLFVMINEGLQLLDEGVALQARDIDLVWVHGYGFPAHLGGPMHYAEQLGLGNVLAGIQRYRSALGDYGELWFQPSRLLDALVTAERVCLEKI